MILSTLYPYQPPTTNITPKRFQGRSRKQLHPIVEHDGKVFVARYEGRQGRVFGANAQVAIKNLKQGDTC